MLTTRQFSAFLKSDQAKTAPAEETAREATGAIKNTEDAIKEIIGAIKRIEDAIKETDATARTRDAAKQTTDAIKGTEDAIKDTTAAIERTQAELVQQGQILSGFTIVTAAFLPLGFCTSVFYFPSII